MSVDLGIEEKYKPIIERHIKFFGNKERLQRFYDLETTNFNEENILTGIMSAMCKTQTNSFEEVIRVLITEDTLLDNKYLEEFTKYNIDSEFWKLCEQQFGFSMDAPEFGKTRYYYVCNLCRTLYLCQNAKKVEKVCFL